MSLKKEDLKNFKATCNECGQPARVATESVGGEDGGDLEVALVCTNPDCANRETLFSQSW